MTDILTDGEYVNDQIYSDNIDPLMMFAENLNNVMNLFNYEEDFDKFKDSLSGLVVDYNDKAFELLLYNIKIYNINRDILSALTIWENTNYVDEEYYDTIKILAKHMLLSAIDKRYENSNLYNDIVQEDITQTKFYNPISINEEDILKYIIN